MNRMCSTKFPLYVWLAELVSEMARRRAILRLRWLPRADTVEADALTNEDFSLFTMAHRIDVDFTSFKWLVVEEMMSVAERDIGCCVGAPANACAWGHTIVREAEAGIRRRSRTLVGQLVVVVELRASKKKKERQTRGSNVSQD